MQHIRSHAHAHLLSIVLYRQAAEQGILRIEAETACAAARNDQGTAEASAAAAELKRVAAVRRTDAADGEVARLQSSLQEAMADKDAAEGARAAAVKDAEEGRAQAAAHEKEVKRLSSDAPAS